MKIFWESDDWPGSTVDSIITCLSWIPNNNETDTGFLATGSESGAVGITATEARPLQDDNKRVNFNLRGHHTSVSIVAWNKEQMKLASCDNSGIIYVWVSNEERWSVELVNDRGIKVRSVSWSPSGSSALICYEDNFVLIGSATGQRIWSSSFPIKVNCGVWAPDSREIILGLNNGTIQVLNEQGATVTERDMYPEGSVHFLAASPLRSNGKWTLAVCSVTGLLNFLNSYDQIGNMKWQCNHPLLSIHWNANGTLLAAVFELNRFIISTYQGNIIYDTQVLSPSFVSALTAFTWAHDDRVIVATSDNRLAVGRVLHGIPRLFSLVTYNVWTLLGSSARHVDILPIPSRERNAIRGLDHHVIRCRIPSKDDLLMKVCEPSDWRWYCTIRPVPHKAHTYVLCMEHMAGLVPILIGKQTNRIIPQFQISLYNFSSSTDNGSSAQVEDIGSFVRPSFQRSSVWRRSKRQLRALMNRHVSRSFTKSNEKLVQITSNVWCTRFKMISFATNILPPMLAQVAYKTSVLHLQPRQMTVRLADLTKMTINTEVSAPHALCVCSRSGVPSSSDSGRSNESSFRNSAIVPTDRNDLIGEHNIEIDVEPLLNEACEEPLSTEERLLFQSILSDFNDLRAAVEKHIARMKCFASDLEKSSQKLDSLSGTTISATSILRCIPKLSVATTASREECLANMGGAKLHRNELTSVEPSSSRNRWPHQIEDIEYIDEDDAVVMHSNAERAPLIEQGKTSETSRKGMRQLHDITSILDKLAKLANDLTTRCTVGQLSGKASPSPRASHLNFQRSAHDSVNESFATVSSLRSQLKDISIKVSQIEKKLNYGDELLNEVCGDLQQRIQHIKVGLGEQPTVSEETTSLLTMNNKAPFWNEASQVYQLDFGGRVTQESAKNFQIEYGDKQVMQFGRIENGAYTLDFCAPFCAVQAFAVALASITQRLK